MRKQRKPRTESAHEAELRSLYEEHGALDPEAVVGWAQNNEQSALHKRFTWDNGAAGHQYRLIQARNLITEVEVIYPDGKARQVYVSPVETRGNGGYVQLAEIMSDSERKQRFLDQALSEYRRLGEKYASLKELSKVRAAVERVLPQKKRQKQAA
jgi:rubrerythrin